MTEPQSQSQRSVFTAKARPGRREEARDRLRAVQIWRTTGAQPMQIREAMRRSISMIGPRSTLVDAGQAMRRHDIDCLPVGEDNRLIGTITARDIATRAVADGRVVNSVTVAEVMSLGAVACLENEPTEHAARLMAEREIRHLPVLGRHGPTGRNRHAGGSGWAQQDQGAAQGDLPETSHRHRRPSSVRDRRNRLCQRGTRRRGGRGGSILPIRPGSPGRHVDRSGRRL